MMKAPFGGPIQCKELDLPRPRSVRMPDSIGRPKVSMMHREGDAEDIPVSEPAPTFKLYFLDGRRHYSGLGNGYNFEGTAEDPKPHCLVTEAQGNSLIARDRATDNAPRYQWAPPANGGPPSCP